MMKTESPITFAFLFIICILLLNILVALPSGCAVDGDGVPCRELWTDCPGIASDYQICASASDLEEEVVGGVRYFSYYNCKAGKRTPTLTMGEDCVLVWR